MDFNYHGSCFASNGFIARLVVSLLCVFTLTNVGVSQVSTQQETDYRAIAPNGAELSTHNTFDAARDALTSYLLQAGGGIGRVERPGVQLSVQIPAEPEVETDVGWTSLPETNTVYYIDANAGDDANDGTSPDMPLQSMEAARRVIREAESRPIVRFKRGNRWIGETLKIESPAVITSYGNLAARRPVIGRDDSIVVDILAGNVEVRDLDIIAEVDGNPRTHAKNGIRVLTTDISGVLIEGNRISGAKDNLLIQAFAHESEERDAPPWIRDVTVRRNVIADAYAAKNEGHSQGGYFSGIHGLLIEGNYYLHNGWHADYAWLGYGEPTQYNHNIYVQGPNENRPGVECSDVEVRSNISALASSHGLQLRPGGLQIGNLYYDNALGTFGGSIIDNVVIDASNIALGTPRGGGIEIGPGNSPGDRISGNIVVHKRDASDNLGGIYGKNEGIEIGPGNIVYAWPGQLTPSSVQDQIQQSHDQLEWNRDNRPDLIDTEQDRQGRLERESNLYTELIAKGWLLPPAQAFEDPSRDLDGYADHIGLGSADLLIHAMRRQRRGYWSQRYEAEAINTWIRAGYEPKPKPVYDASIGYQLPSVPDIPLEYGVATQHLSKMHDTLRAAKQRRMPVMLDWEVDDALAGFDLDASDRMREVKTAEARHILAYARRRTDAPIGLYGVGLPTPQRYNDIRLDDRYPVWREHTFSLEILDDLGPTLYPTLYLPDVWRQNWDQHGEHSKKVLRRVVETGHAAGKLVVPYIRAHDFKSANEFRDWLSAVYEIADGVIYWEHSDEVPEWADEVFAEVTKP